MNYSKIEYTFYIRKDNFLIDWSLIKIAILELVNCMNAH